MDRGRRVITIKIKYDDGGSRRKMAQLQASLDPIKLNSVAGRAGVNVIRAHLLKQEEGRPNALGGARQHYYARAADSTHFTAMQKSALVTVSYVGFRLRRFGGTIKPVNKKFLTIPIIAAAYGRRASEFPGAFVFRSKRSGKAFIADSPAPRVLRLLYRLTTQATIKEDPTIMPMDAEIQAGVVPAMQSYIKRQAARIEAAQNPEGSP
jgi:hypothetical protein